jgi:hypothetical protein
VPAQRTNVFTKCATAMRMLATAQRLDDEGLIRDAVALSRALKADVIRKLVRSGVPAATAEPAVARILVALTSFWREGYKDYGVCPGVLFSALLNDEIMRRQELDEAQRWLRRQLAALN